MRSPDRTVAVPPAAAPAGDGIGPVGIRRAFGRLEASALLAGWSLAVAVLVPNGLISALDPSSELFLAAVFIFWALAVWILHSDLADFLIPDAASAAVAALGLALAAALAALAVLEAGDGAEPGLAAFGAAVSAASGAAATGAGAFAIFWAIGAWFRALGRDALGHGDVKLAGALGVWLSPADAALALELAAVAAVLALVASHRGALRDTAVPFGAFMAPSAWLVVVLAPGLRAAGWLPW